MVKERRIPCVEMDCESKAKHQRMDFLNVQLGLVPALGIGEPADEIGATKSQGITEGCFSRWGRNCRVRYGWDFVDDACDDSKTELRLPTALCRCCTEVTLDVSVTAWPLLSLLVTTKARVSSQCSMLASVISLPLAIPLTTFTEAITFSSMLALSILIVLHRPQLYLPTRHPLPHWSLSLKRVALVRRMETLRLIVVSMSRTRLFLALGDIT